MTGRLPPCAFSVSTSFPSFAVDLEQVWELDSLEYLEALECVTERLESRVNFCKAHLMMITCFDITSRRR